MKRKINVILFVITALFTAFLVSANQASASAYIQNDGYMHEISSACNVGYGENVNGVHLWACAETWAIEDTSNPQNSFPPQFEFIGRVYCYLNGSNSSQVACSSFNGQALFDDANNLISPSPITTCGTGSGHGACSANGITVSAWYTAKFYIGGSDNNPPHYGKLATTGGYETAVDGKAYIGGTFVQVQQWWNKSQYVVFEQP